MNPTQFTSNFDVMDSHEDNTISFNNESFVNMIYDL